ncbi:hypothetical protein MAR_019183 [Mya arenaria]|uniref:Uncharacterized protein n=1 Tax=Mya arenaria TaxID=6604 RepID=A0ABY7EH82_MYAAR|nr:hypothetical protein MAR_019183 [Mya arenaria]
MGSKTLVKQNSSFEDPLTVHPWDNLKNSLIEELTDDDLNREKDDLGQLMNDLLEVLSKELSSKSNMLFEDLPDLYKKKMLIDSIVKMSSQHTSKKGKEYLYESLEMYNAMLSEICRGGVPSIEQSDESIFLELAELIKKGEPPVRSGLDSEYKEAMDAIQAGDATRIDDHNVATFELGKFSKLIPESRRYKSDYDTQEKVRQDVDQDLDNSTNESEKGSESDSNDNSKSISTSDGYGALVIQSEKSQNAKDVSTIFISEAPSSSIAKQTKVLVRQYGIEEHIPETFHADMDTNQDGDVVTMGHNSQSRQSRLSQASDTSSGYFSLKRTSSLTESRRHSTISSFGSEASQTDSCFDASDGEDADDNREEVNEPQPKVHKMENDIDVCKMKLGEG